MAKKLTDFKILTFDCYGTLIDWETGILAALAPLRQFRKTPITDDEVLETFAKHELAQEVETPEMLYSDVLAQVYKRIAWDWGIATTTESKRQFGASVANWPAFADSPEALAYLKQHYKLAILSNVDHASFAHSNRRLGVTFDYIFTAQDIGSYKPDLRNFEYLLARLGEQGFAKSDILHTAESLYHDHMPANRLGISSAWIHRRHAKEGHGATAKPAAMPDYDFRFTSLADMADAHRQLLNT